MRVANIETHAAFAKAQVRIVLAHRIAREQPPAVLIQKPRCCIEPHHAVIGTKFHGALALAITENQELREALRFASAAAALKCTRFGGAFAAPQRAEVDELLRQSPATRPAQTSEK